MLKWFKLAENRIRKAEAEGQLTGLAGEGAPLPDRSGDAMIDAGDAVGFRMMAEAGALPEEIKLKAALEEALREVQSLPDGPERKSAMARAAELQMRYEIAREARKKFLK